MGRRNQIVDSSDESDHDIPNENHLVDVEAEESSEQSDSDSGDSSSQLGDDLLDVEAVDPDHAPFSPIDSSPLEPFPQFVKLPPELRQRVWEFFCPDLASKHGRILPILCSFVDRPGSGSTAYSRWALTDGNVTLEQQTERVRVLGAVHHESRELMVKRFPDTLPIHAGGWGAAVRFSGHRDVVAVEFSIYRSVIHQSFSGALDDVVYDNVRHVAFSNTHRPFHEGSDRTPMDHPLRWQMLRLLKAFPRAETAFVWMLNWDLPINTRWAASPMAGHYLLQTHEEETGVGEDADWMFCWPDTANHPDFSKYNVIEPFRRTMNETDLEAINEYGVKIAPLVVFELARGMEEFDHLVHEHDCGIPIDQDDGRPPFDETQSENEYESEGIDDSEIIDEEESSEDELIPRPIQASDSSEADDTLDEELETAGEHGPAGGARRRKRAIVSDSDDDSDGGQSPAKRARTGSVSAVRSDDFDDPNARSDGSEPQSGESDDDDDDQPPVRLSLAERLRQFRVNNPISSDGEGSNGGVRGEDDEDEEDEYEDTDGIVEDLPHAAAIYEMYGGDGSDNSDW